MTTRTTLREALFQTSRPPTVLIVSDSPIGPVAASSLSSTVDVRLVTDDDGVAALVSDSGRAVVGELTALDTLRASDAGDADVAVVATTADGQNLLIAQLLRVHFGVTTVIVLLNDPQFRDAFDNVATETICGASFLSSELHRAVERRLEHTEPV